jgi:hypothetical protein
MSIELKARGNYAAALRLWNGVPRSEPEKLGSKVTDHGIYAAALRIANQHYAKALWNARRDPAELERERIERERQTSEAVERGKVVRLDQRRRRSEE